MGNLTGGRETLFIMAGNGPYDNRGCEAIVRGTVEILKKHYINASFVLVSNFYNREQFERQVKNERDSSIIHTRTLIARRKYSLNRFLQRMIQTVSPQHKKQFIYKNMLPFLKKAKAVLSIGGDNYSLDYGLPVLFTDLDDVVIHKEKPLILWGASVGPFDKQPEYEQYMKHHLAKADGIFARESVTIEYLKTLGISKNIYRVADPAFLMKAEQPPADKFRIEIPEGSIGINFSPLMADYVTGGNLHLWRQSASEIITHIVERTERTVFLVYHVTVPGSDDRAFLQSIPIPSSLKKHIILIPDNLAASELKWIIGNMEIFAGARTHATIAALSCAVPTLSFSYSIKAEGINKDIFGHLGYCLRPHELTPGKVADKISSLLRDSKCIREELHRTLPCIRERAMNAGIYLKQIIELQA